VTIVLGTRGSALALAQARIVADQLAGEVEIHVIRTEGDGSDRPLQELGDGVFVTALENALRAREIDIAVHSLKDLPTEEREDLVIAAVPQRADPQDVLITASRGGLDSLRVGGVVGTSSPRRAAFLRCLRPDASTRDIRGNVDTRMRKVRDREYDGTILALAGLRRLDVPVGDAEILDGLLWPPAPGQAALAVQCRASDHELRAQLEGIDDRPSNLAVRAERALLRLLGGSCAIPLGAWARVDAGVIVMDAALALADGIVRTSARGSDPDAVAHAAAQGLGEAAHA
jgi:hydroxymethylbilane synthase